MRPLTTSCPGRNGRHGDASAAAVHRLTAACLWRPSLCKGATGRTCPDRRREDRPAPVRRTGRHHAPAFHASWPPCRFTRVTCRRRCIRRPLSRPPCARPVRPRCGRTFWCASLLYSPRRAAAASRPRPVDCMGRRAAPPASCRRRAAGADAPRPSPAAAWGAPGALGGHGRRRLGAPAPLLLHRGPRRPIAPAAAEGRGPSPPPTPPTSPPAPPAAAPRRARAPPPTKK